MWWWRVFKHLADLWLVLLPDGLGVEAEEERDDPDYQLRPGDCGDDDEDDDGGDDDDDDDDDGYGSEKKEEE